MVIALALVACKTDKTTSFPIVVSPSTPLIINSHLENSLLKKIVLDVDNSGNYANLSLYADDKLLIDNLNIPKQGKQTLNALVQFNSLGEVQLKVVTKGATLTINNVSFEDVKDLNLPQYTDISVAAGIDKVSSIKYGGPTIADIDNDGDYDFIVNNHNEESSKLYWNNGDGTVTKHNQNLARWFMHDLHGTSVGDYDNDGDLDMVVTLGGGNGKNPGKANFYQNSNGYFVLSTGDVNIDRGGRGRGAKWSDMDLDGDLDLMLINEASLQHSKPQHYFYKNLGNGAFEYQSIKGLEDQEPSRALITDINGDNIDDVILYSPLSIWQGNGDFTFTEITAQIPEDIAKLHDVMAITDIDIDNDGDLDLYLARGKVFEHGFGEAPSVDHDPISKEFSIKPRGYKGVDEFEFTANGAIKLHQYNFLTQGTFRGKDYPIFLGSNKTAKILAKGEELDITPDESTGWPEDISENGVYFGYLGNGKWQAALVRTDNIFWTFRFSLSGVDDVTLGFEPENRNIADILLKNDNGKFTDVSQEWNIPSGGNSLGVTVGDFNNDSHQDLFVYRWGLIGARISDYMLLNTGKGGFETVTMHGANDVGGPGNGDMGQAFDFDLDGDVDLLNGSEDGEWYLYANQGANKSPSQGNYALVKVGYAPKSNVDAISAEVIVKTSSKEYRKRVGSAGAIFSQSLLNIVHFGLGDEDTIESINIRWRNGETVTIKGQTANKLFDTDNIDPVTLAVTPATIEVRKSTSIKLSANTTPINANDRVHWSSSDESIVTVNESGTVKAIGDINNSATITAKTPTNGLTSSSKITIVDWYAIPVESILLPKQPQTMIEGQKLHLHATVLPEYADNSALHWSSSNTDIAHISPDGTISALQAGIVTINVTSQENTKINNQLEILIKPFIEPYVNIIDPQKYENTDFVVGESIKIDVNYHAGTDNTVISADEGGIRYWLREFKYKWIPAKDIVLTDSSALKTESGSSSMTISLDGLTPTSELPTGHFYYLNVSFASSNGQMYKHEIYPITIVDAKKSN
ncbi:CRTAC1 family protein [Colwellia echini]|uniref:CRTAC1 family protein n=1 Tax=Colwellia echini TaxID=1982103 RepID=A0ABY3N1T5_9GAMM|nr:CRTAC1 family protein [Colwellia echini]